MITDPGGNIEYVNAAFTVMTGYSAQEVIGRNTHLLKSGNQDLSYYRDLWATITAGRNWHGELMNRRKDGTLYTEEMTIAPVLDSERPHRALHRAQAGRHGTPPHGGSAEIPGRHRGILRGCRDRRHSRRRHFILE